VLRPVIDSCDTAPPPFEHRSTARRAGCPRGAGRGIAELPTVGPPGLDGSASG